MVVDKHTGVPRRTASFRAHPPVTSPPALRSHLESIEDEGGPLGAGVVKIRYLDVGQEEVGQ